MPKFTYFINPAGNPELMNWKMSRKDKKFSETYYERQKRLERERLEKERLEEQKRLELEEQKRREEEERQRQREEEERRRKQLEQQYHQQILMASQARNFQAQESTPSKKRGKSRKILEFMHVRRGQGNPFNGIAVIKRQIEERLRLNLRISRDRTEPEEKPEVDGEIKDRRMFLGHAYPEWSKTKRLFKSFSGSDPNVRRSSKDECSESLRCSMTDEEYRDYLNEQFNEQRVRKVRRNSSFLHGYRSK